jgi:hypothetical protein
LSPPFEHTNEVSFMQAPDFDMPGDADGDNTYEIEIVASDDAGTNRKSKPSPSRWSTRPPCARTAQSSGAIKHARLPVLETMEDFEWG